MSGYSLHKAANNYQYRASFFNEKRSVIPSKTGVQTYEELTKTVCLLHPLVKKYIRTISFEGRKL